MDNEQMNNTNGYNDEVVEVIDTNNNVVDNKPNNYLKGFAGAVIGGVAGFAVAVLLYFLGLISALSAFVAVALGSFLYVKFGGKKNKTMLVIVSCTTMVFMILSIFAVYLISSGIAAKEVGVAMSAFEAFSTCMQDVEFSTLFFTDMVLAVVFSFAGIAWSVITTRRSMKKAENSNDQNIGQ